MDKESIIQIDELSKIVHDMVVASKHREIQEKYSMLSKLDTNEITIIRIIAENEDVIIKDIIEEMNIPKSSLTNMIDRLEKKGLVKRNISSRDRRSYKLELTEEGKRIQKEHINSEKEVFEKIICSLDTMEERDELLSLLKKIVVNINK